MMISGVESTYIPRIISKAYFLSEAASGIVSRSENLQHS